jgi:tyrosyl-tRNA synthetase
LVLEAQSNRTKEIHDLTLVRMGEISKLAIISHSEISSHSNRNSSYDFYISYPNLGDNVLKAVCATFTCNT